MEYVVCCNWSNLWLETDSLLLVKAYSKPSVLPWKLRNKCDNCMIKIRKFIFLTTHIYRKRNYYVDKSVNLGFLVSNDVVLDFNRNEIKISNFRIR